MEIETLTDGERDPLNVGEALVDETDADIEMESVVLRD